MNQPLQLLKSDIAKRFRIYFGTGLLVLAPIALTVWIIYQLFLRIDGILRGLVYKIFHDALGLGSHPIPGLGFIALLLLITITGALARNYVGRKFISIGERAVSGIPIISRIYGTIQQISRAFLSEKREVFKKAILFEYPRPGIYSIGFFTQDTKGTVQDALEHDVVSVFLPTTPNPTSGFLLFVPKTDIVELDMPVEEALKLVISGGAIVPQSREKRPPSIPPTA